MDIHAFRVSGNNQQYKVHLDTGRQIPADAVSYWSDRPHMSLRFSIPKFDKKWTSFGLQQPSERWLIAVEPHAFVDVAHAMMKADPQAAIKAFGKAMQEFEISAPDVEQAA